MRFKDYIQEEEQKSTTTNASKEEVYEWIRTNAKHYMDALFDDPKLAIYRGMQSTADYLIGRSSAVARKAAYTSNEVNSLVSGSPDWIDFPPRDRAFICTTRLSTAEGYGGGISSSAYLIIPADHSHMGICPADDFWNSFDTGLRGTGVASVHHMNQIFTWIREMTGREMPQDNPRMLRADIAKISTEALDALAIANTDGRGPTVRRIAGMMKNKGIKNMLEFFNYAFNPELNGFSHTTASDFGGSGSGGREIWINGGAAFLRIHSDRNGSKHDELFDQLKAELYAI